MPDPTPAAPTTPTALHDGYAGGSTTIDLATWKAAVVKMLAETRKRVPSDDGKSVASVQTGHPTDPNPKFWSPRRNVKEPGPLPTLVEEAAIAKDARIEEQEAQHAVPLPGQIDVALYGLAHHLVSHARMRQARQIALRAPRVQNGVVFLETVLVL
jgi:hypothetical protein